MPHTRKKLQPPHNPSSLYRGEPKSILGLHPFVGKKNESPLSTFTARSHKRSVINYSCWVYREMKGQFPHTVWLEVMSVEREEARTLFCERLGKDTLNSIPEMHASRILDRCQGLPSATIRAGRALAGCKGMATVNTRGGGTYRPRNFRYE